MSSYIIAGSADSIDTAYCEQIAKRIMAKYKNIDFRIVIKHASEWEAYFQQICRIYGFLKTSNPIIYTFDGKIIGGRDQFVTAATKYFGLDEEQLIVQDLTSKVNVKLAEEQIKQKNIVKTNFKTTNQKIELKYKQLLSKGIMKYMPKERQNYLVNGIQYTHLELEGLAKPIEFVQNHVIPVINEQIVPQDINLQALTLQDQVKPEEVPGKEGKEGFVTQKAPPSEHDRLSEASKTNKMHESIISHDNNSKGVRQSGKNKLKINEEQDDVPDYIDQPMKDTVICELADNFFVAFDPRSVIGEQLIFYPNVDSTSNALRLYNDNRPIKGHRVIIKEVYYEDPHVNEKQQLLLEIPAGSEEIIQTPGQTPGQTQQPKIEIQDEKAKDKLHTEQKESSVKDNTIKASEVSFRQRKMTLEIQKLSMTEHHIPVVPSQKQFKPDDNMSQPNSDHLNLISHLNHHTLFVHKPLSHIELKNLIYFIRQTDTIATLQFLAENPNPRAILHVRKMLLRDGGPHYILPVQQFISKQLEDKEYKTITLPSEGSEFQEEGGETFKALEIKDIGFNHVYCALSNESQEKIHKIIKYAIDHVLCIEEQVKRDIGYNLIITKSYLMVVPLVDPYEIYNDTKLYLDGLAYLGCIHTAKLAKPYQITHPTATEESKGDCLRKMLAQVSGYSEQQ